MTDTPPQTCPCKVPKIKLDGGRIAHVITEPDPSGVTRTHAVVQGPLERMHARGSLSRPMLEAARRFHAHFQISHFSDIRSMSLVAPSSTPSHGGDLSDHQLDARNHVRTALNEIGGISSLLGSCMWHVVGLEHSMREWRVMRSWTERPLNAHNATGILIAALDHLARHYGYQS